MSAAIPESRERDEWAQVMEGIIQSLGRSLDLCPEVAPFSPPARPTQFPSFGRIDQHLVYLQDAVEKADASAQETDRELEVAILALQQWLGRDTSGTSAAPTASP